MNRTKSTSNYTRQLNLPAAGIGDGWKGAALRLANTGKELGYTKDKVFADIRHNTPSGGNRVSDYDINERIACAWHTSIPKGTRTRRQNASQAAVTDEDRAAYRAKVIGPYSGSGVADLWEISNPRPTKQGVDDALLFLRTIYSLSDYIGIGPHDFKSGNVRTVEAWMTEIETAGKVAHPHILMNPLTGKWGPKRDGSGRTRRGNSCIADHRWALLEFDEVSEEEQFAVCVALIAEDVLDIGAVISSGKKSLHAWVRVDAVDADEWETCVKGDVYAEGGLVDMLGGDICCKTSSRLSRLPGHVREKTGHFQSLLYLNADKCANRQPKERT